MGVGVVPIAILATLFNGMWPELDVLVLAVVLTYSLRLLGLWLSKSYESEVSEVEPKTLVDEDYTLAGMLAAARADRGGRELTAVEIEEVKAWHDKLAEAQKALDDCTAKAEADEREQERLSDLEELKALKTELGELDALQAMMEIKTWVEQAEKYSWGEGVPQDYGEAVKWYRKAAEHGNAAAQYNLGVFYDQGKGVGQYFAEAVQWYRKAAEQGYASAQNNLGVCYYAGQGVPQDHTEAVKWYRKAAEQGHADAQRNLGYCYEHGKDVPQDQTEAYAWYSKAASQGHADAQYDLGRCYEFGKGVPEDQDEAHKWYGKAASQGHADAQYNLDRAKYQNIVFAFSDLLIAAHMPLIGDCGMLPYPKKEILYAIEWLLNDRPETMSEEHSSTFRYLLTVLARDWHEIDPEDKDAIAELGKLDSPDSFPDWALPLKLKYINEQKASEEALDATIEAMKDIVARQNRNANLSDPDFGSRNKLVTKAECEAAMAELKEILSRTNDGTDPAVGEDPAKKS
jgi:TPR repeat protein